MFEHIDRFHLYLDALKKIDVRGLMATATADNLRAMVGLDPLLTDRDRQELGLRLSILAMQIRQRSLPHSSIREPNS